jgi:hypothetical protein
VGKWEGREGKGQERRGEEGTLETITQHFETPSLVSVYVST